MHRYNVMLIVHLLWMILDFLCLLKVLNGFLVHLLTDVELSSVTQCIDVVRIQLQHQATPVLATGQVPQLKETEHHQLVC